jgi:hypothetical protein
MQVSLASTMWGAGSDGAVAVGEADANFADGAVSRTPARAGEDRAADQDGNAELHGCLIYPVFANFASARPRAE